MKQIAKKVYACKGWHPNPRKQSCLVCKQPADILFHSTSEFNRWLALLEMQERGEIRDLNRQVKFVLKNNGVPIKVKSKRYPNGRTVTWAADFTYVEEPGGKWTVEDHKGFRTYVSGLKIGIVETMIGQEVRIT